MEQEIDRIFELASGLQLLVLDADAANLPSQLAKTSLAPLIVYLKVAGFRQIRSLIPLGNEPRSTASPDQVARQDAVEIHEHANARGRETGQLLP